MGRSLSLSLCTGTARHTTIYLPTSCDFQSSGGGRVMYLNQLRHRSFDFVAIKVLAWGLVVKLHLGQPEGQRERCVW